MYSKKKGRCNVSFGLFFITGVMYVIGNKFLNPVVVDQFGRLATIVR